MNIIIERRGGGTMSLEQFADAHNLTMKVHERSIVSGLPRYTASFEGVEVMENGILTSSYGNGSSPEEAIADYAERISGRRLAHNAYRSDRSNFEAPNEFTKVCA